MKEENQQKNLHENFWKVCTGGKLDKERGYIIHDLKSDIS